MLRLLLQGITRGCRLSLLSVVVDALFNRVGDIDPFYCDLGGLSDTMGSLWIMLSFDLASRLAIDYYLNGLPLLVGFPDRIHQEDVVSCGTVDSIRCDDSDSISW